jgi:hypothetical protein
MKNTLFTFYRSIHHLYAINIKYYVIGSYFFFIPTHAQFYNIITSPLYVVRHSECHPQGVTVLKAQTVHRLYNKSHRYE